MDLTKMSDVEIKALAYDQMVVIENAQRNIQLINQELKNRQQPKKDA